jgi:putative heme-binding domain-containing protein
MLKLPSMLRCLTILFVAAAPVLAQRREADVEFREQEAPGQAFPYELRGDVKVASRRPSDIKQGLAMFRAFCSRCHGRDGGGGKGPNLVDAATRRVDTDAEIVDVMVNGITGTAMPGYGPGYEDAYWQITAYLRDAQQENLKEPELTGDVARGEGLFSKLHCASCHWTGNSGGRIGTDLSRLSATADFVRGALRFPNSQIDGTYQPLVILFKDGNVMTGRRLSEDGHHIAMMTMDEELVTVSMDDVDRIKRGHQSLMPSFEPHLKSEDVEDLITYVFSLQRKPQK